MLLVGFPLLLIPFAIYNILGFLLRFNFQETVFSVTMLSKATLVLTSGALVVVVGIFLLYAEIVKAINTPDSHSRLAGVGAEPLSSSVEEFVNYLKAETAQYGKLTREAGIRGD